MKQQQEQLAGFQRRYATLYRRGLNARLPRASLSLMLALLWATATVIAALVLAQIPTTQDIAGVALVMIGIAVHVPPRDI